jgi:hypothetical protein
MLNVFRNNIVLLDELLSEAFDLIVANRADHGILDINPFIFARSNTPDGFIEHYNAMKKLREEIGMVLFSVQTACALPTYYIFYQVPLESYASAAKNIRPL